MKSKLIKSLKKDKDLLKLVKKNLKKFKKSKFKFKVLISKKNYIKMVEKRYISCLLNLSHKEIDNGIKEIYLKYKKNIKFSDILDCLIYQN